MVMVRVRASPRAREHIRRMRVIRDYSGWLVQVDLPHSIYHSFAGPYDTKAIAASKMRDMRENDKQVERQRKRFYETGSY